MRYGIRMAAEHPAINDVAFFQCTDNPGSSPIFFVIYSLITTQVLGVYEQSSEELFNILFSSDGFMGSADGGPVQRISCPANDPHARETVLRQMLAVKKAKNGG